MQKMWFYELIGCVRFAWYCGKMYNRHLFSYVGFCPAFFCSRITSLVLCDSASMVQRDSLEEESTVICRTGTFSSNRFNFN